MVRKYGMTAKERVYEKTYPKIVKICEKLKYQTGFRQYSVQEIVQEARILFFKNFEDYYENENQYLKFLFTSVKNRIRSLQLQVYSFENRYKARMGDESGGEGRDYQESWNNVADPKTMHHNRITVEYLEEVLPEHCMDIILRACDKGVTVDKILSNEFSPEDARKIKKTILSVV